MAYLVKLLLSAGIIVLASELAKRSATLGALIGSLPLVSLLAICWIYYETGDLKKIQHYSTGVFWYVLPSLLFFLLFPLCLQKLPFWGSLLLSLSVTIGGYLMMTWILAKFGYKL